MPANLLVKVLFCSNIYTGIYSALHHKYAKPCIVYIRIFPNDRSFFILGVPSLVSRSARGKLCILYIWPIFICTSHCSEAVLASLFPTRRRQKIYRAALEKSMLKHGNVLLKMQPSISVEKCMQLMTGTIKRYERGAGKCQKCPLQSFKKVKQMILGCFYILQSPLLLFQGLISIYRAVNILSHTPW